MTQPGIEPQSPGPLANTLLNRPMVNLLNMFSEHKFNRKCLWLFAGVMVRSIYQLLGVLFYWLIMLW